MRTSSASTLRGGTADELESCNKMTLATVIKALNRVAQVAPAALPPLYELLNTIRGSKDPVAAARRAAKAAAAPIAAKATANELLKKAALVKKKLGAK